MFNFLSKNYLSSLYAKNLTFLFLKVEYDKRCQLADLFKRAAHPGEKKFLSARKGEKSVPLLKNGKYLALFTCITSALLMHHDYS